MSDRSLSRVARRLSRPLPRRAVQLGLAANALRPVPGPPAALPAMFAGWLTSELAPQLLALTAVDATQELARGRLCGRELALALAASGISAAAYASMIATARTAGQTVEDALRESLGAGYRDVIAREARTDDAVVWRDLARFRMRHADVQRHRRIAYTTGGRRYQLDVYHHRDRPERRPVLLQVHGGGWVIGNKEDQGQPLMNHMAARGWVCAAINYPLSPWSRWPEHIVAVKRAVQWLRENGPSYGADPEFIAVTGGSAGGHLAALLALTAGDPSLQPGFEDADTSVQACAPHYGVYDFAGESGTLMTRYRLATLVKPLVMPRGARFPQDYRAASPLFRVRPDAPPFLVVHGRNDTLVPVPEARLFVDRLRASSTSPVAYAELPGTQHAFDIFPSIRSAQVVRGVEHFLEWSYATRG